MAIKALSGITPEWYTPESEKGESNPTQFHVQPLSVEQFETVIAVDRRGRLIVPASNYATVLEFGVIGWRNFTDEKGDVAFSRANLSRIPTSVRMELATYITDLSLLREEEVKNS